MTNTLGETIEKWTADPQAGRAAPVVQATLADGRARLSAGSFTWDTDLPPSVGGGNQAPSPTAYLLGALAACAVAFINDTLAPEFGVEIDDLSAEARCATDMSGLLGIDGRDPRLTDVAISITVTSKSDEAAIAAMNDAWVARCPIYLALIEPAQVTVNFQKG